MLGEEADKRDETVVELSRESADPRDSLYVGSLRQMTVRLSKNTEDGQTVSPQLPRKWKT